MLIPYLVGSICLQAVGMEILLCARFIFHLFYSPEFMMLYLEEPDHTGHLHGPGSDEVQIIFTLFINIPKKPL